MKTKYLVVAGVAAIAAVVYYFRFRNRLTDISTYENLKKRTAYGEKHIRGIMKKSKPPLNLI